MQRILLAFSLMKHFRR